MAAEHQAKKTEKAQPVKPVVEPAGPEIETQPESFITGSLREMPPGIGRKQILRQQKVAGNRYVQQALLGGVIQRGPGPGGGGDTTPIPTLPDFEARKDLALVILKKAYGGRIKAETKVQEVASESELQTKYDQAMMRQKKKFRAPGNTDPEDKLPDWGPGDAARFPATSESGSFKGFNDPSSGSVFVDTSKKPDDQVATIVHETLHASASPDFPGTLGKQLDEGMTEKLTQNAFTISGYAAPSGQYESEVSFVQDLGGMVGEGILESAYFGGVGVLRSMLNAQTDKDVFEDFAKAARTKDWGWMRKFFKDYFEKLKGGSELEKKIAAINMALDGWVTDDDIANIEGIYSSATQEDKVELRNAIQPRISDLIDIGQRTRLRVLLAS
jgi:hypothetical protein